MQADIPSSRLSDLPRLKRLDDKFDKEPHVAGLLLVEGVDGEQGVGVGLPVGEQSDQGAVRQVVRHEFIRYQDHPEPLHRRLFQGDAVVGAEAGGGQLHRHALRVPGEEPLVGGGGEAVAQAVVLLEILRVGGLARLLQVIGGGAEHPLHLAQGFGAQGGVLQGASPPDHHVQPLIHQIHVGVAQDHLDADLRIAALELADKGVEPDQPVGHGHADPQPAPGGEGGGHDGLVGGLQAVQHGAYLAVIGHAGFGDAQPPGGAVDQRNAEKGFQLVDVLADRRLGEAQIVRRCPEGAHFHHPAKDVQRRDLVHPAPVNSLLVNDGAIIAHFYHNSAVPRGVHPPSPARQRVARGRPARIMALRGVAGPTETQTKGRR